ncbi:MAG: hypothetical protein RL421_251 [Actinomycetota bacterium]
MSEQPNSSDLTAIEIQLGRTPRDVHGIAYRCPCGNPAVVETPPRLSDGSPFPTFFYATCPNLTSEISSLENSELMSEMNERLQIDAELSGAYRAAHDDYLAARAALGIDVPEIADISAGGMPDRVKCLHSLVAHSLASGEGVNPLGDEALARLPQWWLNGNCIERRQQESDRYQA